MDDAQILDKFEGLNRERIERLSSLLAVNHQNFIHLLPLLFQLNSNSLPAYINLETPAGIINYQPNEQALAAAKSHHSAFQYTRRALHYYPISALYLINKNGIFSYNSNEPFELWLIYSQSLSEAQQILLAQKSAAISAWAQAESIPIEIRLFDEATLTSGILPAYDLDLLYCCGLLLAGNAPTWWAEGLNDDRSLKEPPRYVKDAIDFGTVSPLAVQTLFDLTASNINKVMEQGLTSCLDLIYFDCMLEQHTNAKPLSHILKKAIVEGEADPAQLDITSLKLGLISKYTDDVSILALAQQSFYIRSKELLSKSTQKGPQLWRRDFIENKIAEWQWQKGIIDNLDQNGHLYYRQSLSLFQRVRTQIAACLAKLSAFSKQHKLGSSQLQRQLQQKFELLFNEQADALSQLPLAFSPQQSEQYAYLYRKKQSNNWCIDDRALTISKKPLYQHNSLLNVLAWSVNNQLISKATRLKIADENHSIKANVILELVKHLLRSPLSNKPASAELEQLNKLAEMKHILLFANIDHQSSDSLSQHGLEISSLHGDPFNYANKKQNLVASIEGLIYSSWDQWHYFIYTGDDCLLQMLTAVVHWHPTELSAAVASCWCHYGNHGQSISSRIENSYHHVLSHYIAHPESGEYLIALGERLYQLRWQDDLCDVTVLAKNGSVPQHLAKSRDQFYHSAIDAMLDENSLLTTILTYQIPDQIKLFILILEQQSTVYIIDDKGSVLQQGFNNLTKATLLHHFHTFLSSMPNIADLAPPQFFQLAQHYKADYTVTELPLKKLSTKQHYLPVIIEMDTPDEHSKCTIQCGNETFSGAANKPALFIQVSDLLIDLRRSNNNYHLYITQLTFIQQNVPVRDYLLQKKRLEYLLNKL